MFGWSARIVRECSYRLDNRLIRVWSVPYTRLMAVRLTKKGRRPEGRLFWKVNLKFRVRFKVRVRVSVWIRLTFENLPFTTFDLLEFDFPRYSTFQTLTFYNLTFQRIRPYSHQSSVFDLTNFDLTLYTRVWNPHLLLGSFWVHFRNTR